MSRPFISITSGARRRGVPVATLSCSRTGCQLVDKQMRERVQQNQAGKYLPFIQVTFPGYRLEAQIHVGQPLLHGPVSLPRR